MKSTVFTGSAVAVITPFKSDGAVNYEELGRIIDFLIDNASDAIVSCGTTGEASVLTDEEHIELIRYTCQRAGGRVPVIAGTGSNDTAYAVWLSQEAQNVGADALLQVTPYYNKTSQKGLVNHFYRIADAVEIPVILYNVPSRTGMDIKPETYLELSKHKNIVAVKEAATDLAALTKTIELCGDELAVYSGNDDLLLPILSLGGKGVISVLANVLPRQTAEICRLFFEGKFEESRALYYKYFDFARSLFCDVNPIPVKAAMNILGFDAGDCKEPLYVLDDDKKEMLENKMRELKII